MGSGQIHNLTNLIVFIFNTETDAATDRLSAPQYTLWCELLSPWVLRKELLNILYQDGITSLLDCVNYILADNTSSSNNSSNSTSTSAKINMAISSQRTIVFWNMLIAFRLRGLPYTFLLSNKTIVESFPLTGCELVKPAVGDTAAIANGVTVDKK